MAFTVTNIKREIWSQSEVVIGKYVNDGGSTGGNIESGLHHVDACFLQEWGSGIVANRDVVNESFPLASGQVTIVTTANTSGSFMIIGN